MQSRKQKIELCRFKLYNIWLLGFLISIKIVDYWWQASLFAPETIWFALPSLFERN